MPNEYAYWVPVVYVLTWNCAPSGAPVALNRRANRSLGTELSVHVTVKSPLSRMRTIDDCWGPAVEEGTWNSAPNLAPLASKRWALMP